MTVRQRIATPSAGPELDADCRPRNSDPASALPVCSLAMRSVIIASSAMMTLAIAGCQSGPANTSQRAVSNVLSPAWFGSADPGESELGQQWNDWGSRHLQNGDVIFILGHSRVLMGLVNFSKFSTDIAASRFSHVGIVSIENGKPYVYDTISGGPRRKELGWYLARDKIRRVAFRRPRRELAHHIPEVMRFCRHVHEDQIPFDEQFRLNDDKYYCSEFVDEAWREQGVPLCPPIPIDELPNFASYPKATIMMIEATTSISRHQELLLPGNESFGIWSSPALTLLLPEQSPRQVPKSNASEADQESALNDHDRSRQS